eukprot:GHVQ01023992.1.p1 GENE.GHVQ01023992.1~~GHVQ01023992.1.p1  ORF type:complete len:334 (-),score=39.76 GHVQ01023992.1:588-1589(-)
MNRVSADSNHTGSRTSDGSTLSETTGFDSKVEQSISRVHSSVDELTAELYLLKLSLSDVARSGGQPEKFCTPEGKAFPAHLEKTRLSLEVRATELSEELDDIPVKSKNLFYGRLKKLIHSRLDNLEQKTKEIIIRSYCDAAASHGLANFPSPKCRDSLIDLERQVASLSDDVYETIVTYFPKPVQTEHASLYAPESVPISEVLCGLPPQILQHLIAKRKAWRHEISGLSVCLDNIDLKPGDPRGGCRDGGGTSQYPNDVMEKAFKELACRKRILYSKLDMLEIFTEYLLVLDVAASTTSQDTCGSMWWMVQEIKRCLLEQIQPLNRGDTLEHF